MTAFELLMHTVRLFIWAPFPDLLIFRSSTLIKAKVKHKGSKFMVIYHLGFHLWCKTVIKMSGEPLPKLWFYRRRFKWSSQNIRVVLDELLTRVGSRVFLRGGGGNYKSGWCTNLLLCISFEENCIKMKEFGPRGVGGGSRPWCSLRIRQRLSTV